MTATQTIQQGIPEGTWGLDPIHSSATFSVVHNGVSTFRSGFSSFDASLTGGENAKLEGTVDVASIDVADGQLKGHLLSPEFFDAERHPQLRFASSELNVAEDGSLTIRGELDVAGQTRQVEARGRFAELGEDAYGKARVGLSLEATVDRRNFGLDWNAELPSGGLVLDFDVRIAVELELVGEAE